MSEKITRDEVRHVPGSRAWSSRAEEATMTVPMNDILGYMDN